MGKDLNLDLLTKDRIAAYRRSSPAEAALQAAERLKIAERRNLIVPLRLSQLAEAEHFGVQLSANGGGADTKEFALIATLANIAGVGFRATSVTGADGSTLALVDAGNADAAIIDPLTVDQADSGTTMAATLAAGVTQLAAAAVPKATLTSAAGATIAGYLYINVRRLKGAVSYTVTLKTFDRKFRVLGVNVRCDKVAGADGTTLNLQVGSTDVIAQLTLDIADNASTVAGVLSTAEFSSGALKAVVAAANGAELELSLDIDYAVLGTGLQTL